MKNVFLSMLLTFSIICLANAEDKNPFHEVISILKKGVENKAITVNEARLIYEEVISVDCISEEYDEAIKEDLLDACVSTINLEERINGMMVDVYYETEKNGVYDLVKEAIKAELIKRAVRTAREVTERMDREARERARDPDTFNDDHFMGAP